MLKHYLMVALRNLVKHKINSLIKIIGLALGLAAALLVMIVNYSELTWDSFWQDADNIYLVRANTKMNNRAETIDSISDIHYSQFREELGNKLWMTELSFESSLIKLSEGSAVAEQILAIRVAPDFIDIFQPTVIEGDLDSFSHNPQTAFISQNIAKKLFGNESALGKTLTIQLLPSFSQATPAAKPESVDVTIIAVVDIDNPRSHIPQALYFPKLDHPLLTNNPEYSMHQVYLKPKGTMAVDDIAMALNQVVEKYLPEDPARHELSKAQYSLMPITDRHLHDNNSAGNQKRVLILSLLGVLILIVALSNFINLSLAGYVARQKEVALRRIQGASVMQLIWQYWLDAWLYVSLSCLLALILCEIFLPQLKSDLRIPLVDSVLVEPSLIAMIGLVLLVVSIIIALYPAVYFSRLRAATILRANRSSETSVSTFTRKFLLFVQFFFVCGLMIGLAAIYSQLQILDRYEPGYKTKDIVMFIDRSGEQARTSDAILEQLSHMPGFIAAARTLGVVPGQQETIDDVSATINGERRTVTTIREWYLSSDYFSAYGIPLLAGNRSTLEAGFQLKGDGAVPPTQVVLCRTTALQLGFKSAEDALGQTVEIFKHPEMPKGFETTVRAVIEDIHLGSHKKTPRPCMYLSLGGLVGAGIFAINFDHAPSEQEIESIRKIWIDMTGVSPHHWMFSGSMADRYKHERNLQWFMSVFVLVALLIGLLGIYGVTALNAQKRAREIALRKLHGARHWQIVKLLNRDFSLMVIVANLFAWPCAIYFINGWLKDFHQHFSLPLWLPVFCLVSLGGCLIMVWVTATGHSLATSRLRPAEVLRDE